MKNQIIYILFILAIISTFSCSDNNEVEAIEEVEITTQIPIFVCGEDMTNYNGTICCVSGSEVALPGQIKTYTYETNRNNTIYEWTVNTQSISIISGENTATLTVRFEDNFTTGIIGCTAFGDLACEEALVVNRIEN